MSSSFTSVYMAAEDKASNGHLGTWSYPVTDAEYSSFECFGGDTVIAFRSNVSTTTVSFTWSLPINAKIPAQGFFFKATIVENGTAYWSEVASVTVHVEFTCFEDSILFFPSGDVGVFVIIPEPVCSRQMVSCNGTLSGTYPIGEHIIQCNCTDGNESTDTCDISFEVGKNVCKQIFDNHNLIKCKV
ncbi:hypothetical protein HOLleu_32752 [Holothuria leucospilota]|uniref:Reelin domain-containing protein n=1 Tax=Holothuria leucospilota TaxID=206669 RepID=A0A9Q1BJ76_HOLLE|nr:hypothetical protein HOLleu_32752 [Holothuria leucospilota]